jgi:hypothetical protein
MYIAFDTSDIITLSIAAACLVAAVTLELLRVIIPDIYEWFADHRKVREEILDAKRNIEKLTARNREQGASHDRKNAERFRLKSTLSRAEVALSQLERERFEVWHELGESTVADQLFVCKVYNRLLADKSQRDADGAPAIWRFGSSVRIWAQQDRAARSRLQSVFPQQENFSFGELTQIPLQAPTPPPAPPPPPPPPGRPTGRPSPQMIG